jgi:plasmid maintenance system antidote protein VapI
MATTPNQNSLEQDLIELLNRRRGIEEASLDDARDLANFLQAQTRELKFQIAEKTSLRSVSRDIVKIATQAFNIQDKELGTLKGLKDLSKQRLALEQNILTLTTLKNKVYEGDAQMQFEINQAIEEQIKTATKLRQELEKVENTSNEIAKNFGVKTFGAINDITKAIPGLRRFSEPFEKASEAARKQALQNQDAFALKTGTGLTKEKIKQLGLEKELGNLLGTAAAAKAKALGIEIKSQNTLLAGAKALGPALAESFGPMFLIIEAFKSFLDLDKTIGDTAKQLGVSYNTAAGLSQEFNTMANKSGNIFITTKGINESFLAINAALGTNADLNEELLVTQTELTKQAFYSVEAATAISKLSLATGKPAKEITTAFLGQAKALNLVNNTAINEKVLLESIAKTSKATLITFAAQPGKLAEAAYEAKKVGLNLEEIKGIQDSLLNIESSIAAEFEAEVITGKQLNLERARYYALTNDIAGVAKELSTQGIDQSKFAKMNLLQQESVAKAMGMSRDQMAGMLMDQAAMNKLSQVDGDTAKEKFNNLVKQVGLEEAKKQLGDETLANQMASASMQDRFLASVEKLKEVFVALAEPLMPVLDIFTSVLQVVGLIFKPLGAIMDWAQSIGGPLKTIVGLLTAAGIAALFLNGSLTLGIGVAIAMAAIGGAMAQLESSTQNAQQVQDGMAPSSKGPFTVTDRYGATAITAPGDHIAVSPNIRTQPNYQAQQPQSPIIDYEKLGAHIAKAVTANPIQAVANIDGVSITREMQTPMGITTRKI